MSDAPTIDELCQRGKKHLRAGRAREALAIYEEARQLNDLDPDAHEGLASAHCALGEIEQAARHFEMVTRLDPRRAPSWINLGALYNRLGQHQKAAEVLRRAVQVDRKSSIGYYNLGIAYKQLRQWTLAVPAYREAIRLDPKMPEAHLNLANVYLEMNNVPLAITSLHKALEIDPDFAKAKRALEKAEARQEEARNARTPFGRLVDGSGSDSAAPAQITSRKLTEAERKQDRVRLAELLEYTTVELKELMQCLAERLDPSLRTLNRMLTHKAPPQGESLSKADALEQFDEALEALAPRMQHFRRVLQKLRDHEASVR